MRRFALVLGLLGSCGAPPEASVAGGRLYEASMDRVEAAVLSALEGRPVLQSGGGIVRTNWHEAPAERSTAGYLLGSRDVERDRFRVRIITVDSNRVRVEVEVEVERRPALGAAATRWERVFSDGRREERFHRKLQEVLG